MDRNRHTKIIKYITLYLVYAVFFTAFLYSMAHRQISGERQRLVSLMARYPHLETELISLWKDSGSAQSPAEKAAAKILTEKYGYRADISSKNDYLPYWCAGLLAGVFFLALAGYLERRAWKKNGNSLEKLQTLYECLEQFRKGEFCHTPDPEESSEIWMNIWETLRELGVYFEDLGDQLAREEESTKALITDISHQLKTPLASLRMSHELSKTDSLSEQERREFLEREEKEIDKLELLLTELVNLSRLETHMIQLRPISASLRNTITEAVSQIYVKARSRQIEIQLDMDGDIAIPHDTKWTVEALANVLDNAVKYSGENTTVTVRVQPLVNSVLIEIEDEGMGIPQKELTKIYQRFYRGSAARERVKEGAGVGLYLTRMILERQNGTISARRRMEGGTVFLITLQKPLS